MSLNTRALKKLNTLPDDPEFIIGIEGKDVPFKVGVAAAKVALGVTASEAAIEALETTVGALPAAPSTTIVNITSAQILAMGTTPIELLPAPGVGMYYEWEMILEFTAGNVAYTTGGDIFINDTLGNQRSQVDSYLIGDLVDQFAKVYPILTDKASSGYVNSAIEMTSTNPTLGNGTLRAIITYTVRTFGA